MNETECRIVVERLFRGEDPANPPPDIRVHLSGCAECRRAADSLSHVDSILRNLPPAPDSSAARDRFLRRLQAAPGPRIRHRLRAAAVLAATLVAAFTIWMFSPQGQPQAQAADPIDELLEWNLRLSDASTAAERQRLLSQWRRDADRFAPAPPGDRELVAALLADAEWLAAHDDPAAHAVRFADVVDRFVARLREPADAGSAERDGRRLELVIERGVAANIRRTREADPQAAAVRLRVVASSERLHDLMERVPESARPGLARALAAADRNGFIPPGLRKKIPASTDAGDHPDRFIPPGLLKKQGSMPKGKGKARPGSDHDD